jgi:hypothetical protein
MRVLKRSCSTIGSTMIQRRRASASTLALTLAGSAALAGCKPGLNLGSSSAKTEQQAKEDFECAPAHTDRRFFCTKERSLLGQEETILGTVYKVDKVDGQCPEPGSDAEKREEIVPGLNKQGLTLTNPVATQVDFALVKRNVAASVEALQFLSASLSGEAIASVDLLRNTRRVVEDQAFGDAVSTFARKHPTACRLYVATGYGADYFSARVFTAQKATAGGGVYGVKVSGEYYASDESVMRDFQWAINIVKVDIGTATNDPNASVKFDFEEKLGGREKTPLGFELAPPSGRN